MQLETKKCLEDVRQASELIAQFTAGKIFSDYDADAMLRSAVERQFEIIGEAVKRIAKLDDAVYAEIPETSRIIAFRNILVHGYDVVDNQVVWDVIKYKLPQLSAHVSSLLSTP
jgi:uncharacterized protein with HEPN domain